MTRELRPAPERRGDVAPHAIDGGAEPEISTALHGVLHLETVVQRLGDALMSVVPSADGIVVAMDDGDGLLRIVHAAGATHGLNGAVLPSESLSRRAMASGTVLRCDDASSDPRVFKPALGLVEMSSMLAIPLQRGGCSFGVVDLGAHRAGAFDDADVATCTRLAQALAPIVTIVTEAAQLVGEPSTSPPSAVGLDSESIDPAGWLVAKVLAPEVAARAELRQRIAGRIASGDFTVVFQPVVALPTLELAGVEALARFPGTPRRPPDRWFADAERVGLGVQLELAAAAKALGALDELPGPVSLAVNVGPRALADPGLRDLLERVDLSRVVVELTEHAAVDDYPALRRVLAPLRRRGVRLAVDDTGAGFASLTHIANLRPDFVKLDRWIVCGVHRDPVRRSLAGSLVGFAHAIDAQVIAEGIQDAAELATLADVGADFGQGFHIARPSALAEILLPEAVRPSRPSRGAASRGA